MKNDKEISAFDFDFLTPFINNEKITDINFNGHDLWVDSVEDGRIRYPEIATEQHVLKLCMRFANFLNVPFNQQYPVVESDFRDIRVSILHPTICRSISISIRKTSMVLKLNETIIESTSYMSVSALRFLKYVIRSRCNVIVSGLPGAGKTELIKYLSGYIAEYERVITIEDSCELHIMHIYPDRDCVEIKVSPQFMYEDAIKASLRQRPNWLLLSEVRGIEVVDLMTCISTGICAMSTIHSKSAYEILNRIESMIPSEYETLRKRVKDAFHVGVHVDIRIEGNYMRRYVREIVVYSDDVIETVYTHKMKRLLIKIPSLIKERAESYAIRW